MPLFIVDMGGVSAREWFNRHRLRSIIQQCAWELPSATTFIIDPNRLRRLLYCCCNHFTQSFRQPVKTIVLNTLKSDLLNLNNLHLFRKCTFRDLTVFGNLHRGQTCATAWRFSSLTEHNYSQAPPQKSLSLIKERQHPPHLHDQCHAVPRPTPAQPHPNPSLIGLESRRESNQISTRIKSNFDEN